MVTKGEIRNIDILNNTCTVRIPLFETAGVANEYITDATIAIQPGVYNGYSVGDIVMLAFEDGSASSPVVIGKLYLGYAEEAKNAGLGAINCSTLDVKDSLIIPGNTKISFSAADKKVANNKGLNNYKTIADIATAISSAEHTAAGGNTVRVSENGTATEKVNYITIDGVEKKIGGSFELGTISYNSLADKPKINGIEIGADVPLTALGLSDVAISGDFSSLKGLPDMEAYATTLDIETVNNAIKKMTLQMNKDSLKVRDDIATLNDTASKLELEAGRLNSLCSSNTWAIDTINNSIEKIHEEYSDIEQTTNKIALTVYENDKAAGERMSKIEQTADQIKMTVENYTTGQSSLIEQTASNIRMEVSEDLKDKVNTNDHNTTNTFGWNMTADGVTFYDESHDVLKIDERGLEVSGTIRADAGLIGCRYKPDLIKSKETANFKTFAPKLKWDYIGCWLKQDSGDPVKVDNLSLITAENIKNVIIKFTNSNFDKSLNINLFDAKEDRYSINCFIGSIPVYHTDFKFFNIILNWDDFIYNSNYAIINIAEELYTNAISTNPVPTIPDAARAGLELTEKEIESITQETVTEFYYELTEIEFDPEYINYNMLEKGSSTEWPPKYFYSEYGDNPPEEPQIFISATIDGVEEENKISLDTDKISFKLYVDNPAASRSLVSAQNYELNLGAVVSDLTLVKDEERTGFHIGEQSIYNGIDSLEAPGGEGVYIGVDGIRVGNGFIATKDGTVTLGAEYPTRDWVNEELEELDTNIHTDMENADSALNSAINNVQVIANGKNATYYSETNPSASYEIKKGDCWFCTGYYETALKSTFTDVNKCLAKGKFFYKSGSNYIEVTEDNWGTLASNTILYRHNELYQYDGSDWVAIGGELVASKITANYINALDITTKKITVLNNSNVLFKADGTSSTGTVTIGKFNVGADANKSWLTAGKESYNDAKDGVYLGTDGISLGAGKFYVTNEGAITASSGKIGGLDLSSNTLSNGSLGADSSVFVSIGKSGTISNLDGSEKTWAFTAGKNFGVTTNGNLYAKAGKIGGFNLSDSTLSSGAIGADNSVFVSTGLNGTIAGQTETNWAFTAGKNFGVTTSGNLYSKAGKIGDFKLDDGKLLSYSTAYGRTKAVDIRATQIDVNELDKKTNGYNFETWKLNRISQTSGMVSTDLGRLVFTGEMSNGHPTASILPAIVGLGSKIDINELSVDATWSNLNNKITKCAINAVYHVNVKSPNNYDGFEASEWRSIDFANSTDANGIAKGFTPIAAFMTARTASSAGSISGNDAKYYFKDANLYSILVNANLRKVYYIIRDNNDAAATNRIYTLVIFGYLANNAKKPQNIPSVGTDTY